MDGSVNFYRTWETYRHGFGNLEKEFWLGMFVSFMFNPNLNKAESCFNPNQNKSESCFNPNLNKSESCFNKKKTNPNLNKPE
jgi:hypothetical protein